MKTIQDLISNGFRVKITHFRWVQERVGFDEIKKTLVPAKELFNSYYWQERGNCRRQHMFKEEVYPKWKLIQKGGQTQAWITKNGVVICGGIANCNSANDVFIKSIGYNLAVERAIANLNNLLEKSR